MKLLFDQNLSFRHCATLSDVLPGSVHVRHVGLDAADDRAIWEYAERNGYTIVSQDADFAEMAIQLGGPPKVIWIRAGNLPTGEIASLWRSYAEIIAAFDNDDAVRLEIY